MPLRFGTWHRAARQHALRLLVALVLGWSLALGQVATALPSTLSTLDVSSGTAIISGSGDGVHLRAEAGFGSEVLTVVPEGATVELMIETYDTVLDPDGATRWWPVAYQGVVGWVSGYYLTSASGSAPEEDVTGVPASDTRSSDEVAPTFDGGADPAAATARVADPQGVNVRAEPDLNAPVIGIVAAGGAVVLRTSDIAIVYDVEDRAWWPVDFNGQLGWVIGAYLTSGADERAGTVPSDLGIAFAPGQYVMVVTGTGQGLNLRATPAVTADRVGFVLDGAVIQVMDGPHGFDASSVGWYLVTNGSVTGYVDGDLLSVAEQPAVPADETSEGALPETPDAFAIGAIAVIVTGTGEPLNLRTAAGRDAEIIAEIPEQTPVEILEGPFADEEGVAWYLVTTGEAQGYLAGQYLTTSDLTKLPMADAGPIAPPTVAAEAAPASLPTATPTPQSAQAVSGPATGAFIYPTTGKISQYYGCSPFPYYPIDGNLGCSFHNGLDIATQAYTPVVAADGGRVIVAGWCDCGLGYYVKIDHGNGYVTTYGHMAELPYVNVGDVVQQGDVLGPVGSTGFSTGPHVHFGVEYNGKTIDPRTVLGAS